MGMEKKKLYCFFVFHFQQVDACWGFFSFNCNIFCMLCCLTLLMLCLLLNSCVLYWGQRWKYYGLGHQVQQKRYQLDISISTVVLCNFFVFCQTQYLFLKCCNILGLMGQMQQDYSLLSYVWRSVLSCLCLPFRWFLQTSKTDQWRSQQSRDKPPPQNKEEAEQHTWNGSQCGEFFFQQL